MPFRVGIQFRWSLQILMKPIVLSGNIYLGPFWFGEG